MTARMCLWLLLVVGVSGGGSGIAAADTGWMQPGVRVWYLGAVGTAGVEIRLKVLRGVEIQEIKVKSIDRHQWLLLGPRKT